MPRKVYQRIASSLQARETCLKTRNTEWFDRHNETIQNLIRRYLPSGGGVDCGTKLDDSSTPNRLVFTAPFHHMNEHGSYDGWTDHSVIVTPDLAFGFHLKITGRDRNNIKDYLADTFGAALSTDVDDEAFAVACGVSP